MRRLGGCLAFLLVCAGITSQAAHPVVVTMQEPWANVFAGKEAVFHAVLTTTEPFDGRMVWRFSADGRTLARGEGVVKAGPGSPATIEVRLTVPPVNPGVIMPTTLSISVQPAENDKAAATLDRTIWVFPEDPFTGRMEWLKRLNIQLFDPVGDTAKLFTEIKIPFSELRNVDSLAEGKEGVLVVGEGVPFKDYRGLAERLIKVAAAGRPVLCLAPADGDMQLPVSGEEGVPQPESLLFLRQDMIKQLDKRLDAEGWQGSAKVAASGLLLRGDRGPVVAEVSKGNGGWPWMELKFEKRSGKFVLCGFGIVGGWAESPTPRFLFVKVLERVSGKKIKE